LESQYPTLNIYFVVSSKLLFESYTFSPNVLAVSFTALTVIGVNIAGNFTSMQLGKLDFSKSTAIKFYDGGRQAPQRRQL
jgi:hypothetical protein